MGSKKVVVNQNERTRACREIERQEINCQVRASVLSKEAEKVLPK